MKSKQKILAIIPARGGSKRVPRKNIRFLMGKPLIAYTIEAALKSKYINKVVVSTDDGEIAGISEKYGAEVIKRPKKLAKDTTLTFPVVEHALECLAKNENYKPDMVIWLEPTSPLRGEFHVDKAIEQFLKDRCDSLLSVCSFVAFLWEIKNNKAAPLNYNLKKRLRTQDKKPDYRENGAIYITKYEIIVRKHNILGKKIGLYIMPEQDSADINTEEDFIACEDILRNKNP